MSLEDLAHLLVQRGKVRELYRVPSSAAYNTSAIAEQELPTDVETNSNLGTPSEHIDS